MNRSFSSNTSSNRVLITGSGLVSPLADSADALHRSLCAGESGLAEHTFDDLPTLGPHLAGRLDFEARDYLPTGKLRPLDRTGMLVIAAARLALENAGLAAEACAELEVGLVLGTMYCSLHTIAAFDQRALSAGPQYVRPFDFANSVINAAAGQTAIWHQLRGINATIAGGSAAGLEALAYASDLIRTGRSELVVAGGSDELCFESFLGFQRSGMLCGLDDETPRPVPFDSKRNGFALAEGATLLVLESETSARRRGAQILGEICGHGSSFDPSRSKDPASARESIDRTFRLALEDAALTVDQIDAFSASANGSRISDEHEALAATDTFADRQQPLPVTAVKSMVGEALGASGALQTLAMVQSLRHGELPGIPGLQGHGFEELSSEQGPKPMDVLSLSSQSRSLSLNRAMVSAVGMDGHSCSLVVSSGEIPS